MSVVSQIKTARMEDDHYDGSTMVLGFWIYILTDLILFATLFANFAVFSSAYNGGPHGTTIVDGEPLFNLNYVLVETFLLLISSITYGLAMVQANKNNLSGVRAWMAITFILGLCFIIMEVNEFHHLVGVLHDPAVNPAGITSAFFSAFFVLVGTHGLHVTVGLIWMALMFFHLSRAGLDSHNKTRLNCLSLFWHFLDIVWVGVFTAVYLLGVL